MDTPITHRLLEAMADYETKTSFPPKVIILGVKPWLELRQFARESYARFGTTAHEIVEDNSFCGVLIFCSAEPDGILAAG